MPVSLNFRSFRAISSGSIRRWHTPKDFSTAAIANKTGGFYTSLSPIDGIERRFAVQRFENTPLFITAGISSTAIRNEWIAGMAPHLIFGIPATLVMFLTLFTVLRRTMHLYQGIDRRAAAEEALRQSQKLEASARTSRSRLWGALACGRSRPMVQNLIALPESCGQCARRDAQWRQDDDRSK